MVGNIIDDPVANPHSDRNVTEWMVTDDLTRQKAIEIDIAGRMDLGVCTAAEVIRDMQPYMGEDASLPDTAKALRLVVQLLNTIQVPLERNDVHVLVEYFCERLENSEGILNYRAGIKESAEALIALANMTERKRFPPGDAALIAKAIFAVDINGTLRSQKASARVTLYQLLNFLTAKYKPNIVKDIGPKEFVQGIVSMAELEKDPSCLRILFGMYDDLSQNWGLGEDTCLLMWESFSRYFPITLGGAAKDPAAATPDELKTLLVNCFISNDFHAQHAFPRLLDMLDTNQDLSANIKKDVFDTMAACVKGYGPPILFEWAPKVWDSLKFEVWNGENEEFVQGALKVINAVAQAVATPYWAWYDENTDAARLLNGILKDCVERIVDSKQRYMLSTGRIIYAIASASPYTFSQATKKTLPALLILWEDLSYNSEKTPLLGIFNLILRARIEVGKRLEDDLAPDLLEGQTKTHLLQSKDGVNVTLTGFKERLVEQVYWKAMTEGPSDSPDDTSFRINIIQGLVLLAEIPNFLLDFEQGTVISSLNKIALDCTQSEKMHDEAVDALQQVSMHDPGRFSTITLTNFMDHLPPRILSGSLRRGDQDAEIGGIVRILEALMRIACKDICKLDITSSLPFPSHAVFDAFQKSMLMKLFDILAEQHQLVYANVILAAVVGGLQMFDAALDKSAAAGVTSSPTDPQRHPYAWFVLRLYQKLAVLKQTENGVPYIGLNLQLDTPAENKEKFVSLAGEIATLALRSNQTTPPNNFLNSQDTSQPSQIWSLFCENVPNEIDASQMDLKNAPEDKYLANVLSMSLVAGIRREECKRMNISAGNVGIAMIKNAITLENPTTPFARVAMLHFLQLLVNKFGASAAKADGDDLPLAEVMKNLVTSSTISRNDPESERIYQTLCYFTAAALARCERSDKELITLMIEGISHPSLGRKVAQSFRTLMAPSNILIKENHCMIRPLRQGRLYAYAVDSLLALWRSASSPETRSNALIALAGILAYMTPEVYTDSAATLIPLMLSGTNIQEDFTKLACIAILRTLIPLQPTVITSHLDSVINRMTDRTRNTYYSPSDANVEARSAAIDVLALLTKYVDTVELVKRKASVIRELDIAVDDCSSVVRGKAAGCKLKWWNVGAEQ